MLKRFGKFLLYCTFFFLLFVLIIVILAKVYNKEIKRYALETFNQYLTAQVHVGNVQLDLLRRFPQATLIFENVHIEDANDAAAGDTMLYAKELLLKFDFLEVFNGHYTIEQIEAHNALLNLSVNSDGKENYLIWKQNDSVEKKQFQFQLKNVICIDTKVIYNNELTDQFYSGNASEIDLAGAFYENNFDLSVQSDLIISSARIGKINYVHNERAKIETILSVDKKNRIYTIDQGKAKIGQLNFSIDGNYQAESSQCDLNVEGKELLLHEVFTVFPSVYFERFAKYKSDGVLSFKSSIKGSCTKNRVPEIHAEFSVKEGQLVEPKSGMQLHNLHLAGTFTNSNFGALKIEKLSGSLLNSTFNGALVLANFDTPDLDISIDGKLELASLQSFFQFKSIESLNGQLNFNAHVLGRSESGRFRTKKSKGNFTIENANLKTKLNDLEYSNLNGAFSLDNENATISGCSGNIFNSDFNVAGVLRNLIPFILGNEEVLTIEADLDSRFIDLSKITAMASSAHEAQSSAPQSILPNNLAFNLNATVETLTYGQFDATDLRGIASLKNRVLKARNVRFRANEGTYRGDFEFDGSNANNYLFSANGKCSAVKINNLFEEFNNFGQTFLQSNHVNGSADVTFDFACALDNGFAVKPETILSKSGIQVVDGELNNLQSMQEIATYLEDNKLIRPFVNTALISEKLSEIRFSKLSNTIEIKNKNIMIPRMEISSSVMDIEIKGEHSFDNRINYGFNFRLRDVLMKENNDEEFGYVVDDGSGYRIFLSMTGTVDAPVFGIDKEEKRLAKREKRKQEKQTLKSVLKADLGLYKNDSSVVPTNRSNKRNNVQFEIDWDETDTAVVPVKDEFNERNRKKRRNVMQSWLKNKQWGGDSLQPKDSVSIEFDDN